MRYRIFDPRGFLCSLPDIQVFANRLDKGNPIHPVGGVLKIKDRHYKIVEYDKFSSQESSENEFHEIENECFANLSVKSIHRTLFEETTSKSLSALLFLSFFIPVAFAEAPTPYNEWDFDFGNIEIYQNPNDLKEMIISVPVIYKGEKPLGTVSISAMVIGPDGRDLTLGSLIRYMEIGERRTLNLKYEMPLDGLYKIDVIMTPPEEPYLGHIFDAKSKAFQVEPNGRERNVKSIESDFKEITEYKLEEPESIEYFEVVHAVISLPKQHFFEKITLTNFGKVVKDYSTDTKDIYIKSNSSYEHMKINLIKAGNLLQSADAKGTLQNYVKYYAVDRDSCYYNLCANIDIIDYVDAVEIDIPIWVLLFLVICLLIVLFVMSMKSNAKQEGRTPYINEY